MEPAFRRHLIRLLIPFRSETDVRGLLVFALSVLVLLALLYRDVQDRRSRANTIRFVQITDAHIFDSGRKLNGVAVCQELSENLSALQWAIQRTNAIQLASHSSGGSPKVDFLVFTGDFGLENVFDKSTPKLNPPERRPEDDPCEAKNSSRDLMGPILPIDIDNAANRIADIFSHLDEAVPIYLVPGNNDLIKEDPDDFPRYRHFVALLQGRLGKRIIDLSQETANISGLSILGLNTASFKPTDTEKISVGLAGIPDSEQRACTSSNGFWIGPSIPLGAEPTKEFLEKRQKELAADVDQSKFDGKRPEEIRFRDRENVIEDLRRRIPNRDYILFTHVPDVRDPILDCSDANNLPRIRYRSSWFLSSEAREEWASIVNSPQQVAVFAGHFHSSDRSLYGLLKGPEPSPLERIPQTAKTYVAPPLAIKYQTGKQPTARGLMLVDLTFRSSHWVVAEGERPSIAPESVIARPTPIWYESIAPQFALRQERGASSLSKFDRFYRDCLAVLFIAALWFGLTTPPSGYPSQYFRWIQQLIFLTTMAAIALAAWLLLYKPGEHG